jgi:hypothetical protein
MDLLGLFGYGAYLAMELFILGITIPFLTSPEFSDTIGI